MVFLFLPNASYCVSTMDVDGSHQGPPSQRRTLSDTAPVEAVVELLEVQSIYEDLH